jgi:hypothetical protein
LFTTKDDNDDDDDVEGFEPATSSLERLIFLELAFVLKAEAKSV